MAVTLNASTTAGLVTSADTSGNLNLQSGGSTKIAVTSAGVAVTGLSKGSLPTGSVLQVVNATYSTQSSTTSGTPADTGLTATITPTSATSKILIFVNQTGLQKSAADTTLRGAVRLVRGSTSICLFDVEQLYTAAAAGVGSYGSTGTNFLDSPATTSATTYKTQIYLSAGTGTLTWCTSSSVATITLMEIAA
jgi:hypothetical protein